MQETETQPIPPVRILLFGEMGFSDPRGTNTKSVAVPSRLTTKKPALFFAYLLLHPGKTFDSEKVADLFWPESDNTESAKRSLRDTLSFVRGALTEAGFPTEGIQSKGGRLCFTGEGFVTDVADFEKATNRGTNREAVGIEMRIAALEQAVALYRGELLTGFNNPSETDLWLEDARKKYAHRFDDALIGLARLYQKQGDLSQALYWARRAMENRPDDTTRPELVQELIRQITEPAKSAEPSHPPETVTTMESATIVEPVPSQTPILPTATGGTTSRRNLLVGLTALGTLGSLGYVFALNRPSTTPLKTTTTAPNADRKDAGGKTLILAEPNIYEAADAKNMTDREYEQFYFALRHEMMTVTNPVKRKEIAYQLRELGDAAHFLDRGRGAIAIDALQNALSIYREQKAQFKMAQTLLVLSNAHLLMGDRPHAIAQLDEAYRITDTMEPLTQANLLIQVGEAALDLGDYPRAYRALQKSQTIYRQGRTDQHKHGLAFYLRFMGDYYSDTGDYKAAEKHLTESVKQMTEVGEPVTRAAVLGSLGTVYLRQGDPDRAVPLYREGLAIWEKQKQTFWTAKFKGYLARVAFYQGLKIEATQGKDAAKPIYEAARQQAKESLSLFDQSNGPAVSALPLGVLARVDIQEGFYSKANNSSDKCVELQRSIGNPCGVAESLELQAKTLLNSGVFDEARQNLLEAAALRKKAGTSVPPCDLPFVNKLRRDLGLPPL